MTALKGYERLEATALWRPEPGGQRRDVYVFLRDATLVIADRNETALAHWSLPAVERLNPGTRPALLAPGPEADETLEIEDTVMIDAINTVQAALRAAEPKPGRLRLWLGLAALAGVAAMALFWLPGALVRQADAVVPEARRADLGARLQTHVAAIAGPLCGPEGMPPELARLARRLVPADPPHLVLVRGLPMAALLLPGDTVLLSDRLLGGDGSPELLAGHVLTQLQVRAERSALARLLDRSGTVAVARLLTTGDIPEDRLAAHAVDLLDRPLRLPADGAALAARFTAAQVDPGPFLDGTDLSQAVALRIALTEGTGPAAELLPDNLWVALQNACD